MEIIHFNLHKSLKIFCNSIIKLFQNIRWLEFLNSLNVLWKQWIQINNFSKKFNPFVVDSSVMGNSYKKDFFLHGGPVNFTPISHSTNDNTNGWTVLNHQETKIGADTIEAGSLDRFRNPACGPLRKLTINLKKTLEKINKVKRINRTTLKK